jgi:hypothetical protein
MLNNGSAVGRIGTAMVNENIKFDFALFVG